MTASFHDAPVRSFNLELYGDPISHSLSPVLHTAALEAAGLIGSYRTVRVDRPGLEKRFGELRRGCIDGANVTMPHKRAAAQLVDELSPGAGRAQSVNTVVTAGPELVGHSTDIEGVLTVWDEAHLPGEAPVLILGAGGAAAAAVIALEDRMVYLAARQAGRAEGLLHRLGVAGEAIPWGRPIPGAVVVNATPLGMEGETLPAGIVEESSGLLDMPYRHGSTAAVRRARRNGLPHATGMDLLIAQAAASFTLWTGQPAPLSQMRTALQNAQATE
jgi:shikimate dehydrogenase